MKMKWSACLHAQHAGNRWKKGAWMKRMFRFFALTASGIWATLMLIVIVIVVSVTLPFMIIWELSKEEGSVEE